MTMLNSSRAYSNYPLSNCMTSFSFTEPSIRMVGTPSETFDERIPNALRELHEVYNECSTEDWDCYGAQPVTQDTYDNAGVFLRLLPDTMPMPEIGAEPDGEISLEWYLGPYRNFSVSIGEDEKLSYAGLLGKGETYGVEIWQYDIPDGIIYNLKKLYDSE